jgi:hypothetical protein
MTSAATNAVAARGRISNQNEAIALVSQMIELADALCAVFEEETALVRAGRLSAAIKVADRKAELAQIFMIGAAGVEANMKFLSATIPGQLATLRAHHDRFRLALQANLTVLGTARAVSEGILRGVSKELARRSSLQTYGSTGRQQAVNRRAVAPIAFSRHL